MSPFIMISLQFTVLAYAIIGGVFLTFSDFIMRSLASSPQGEVTMQVINREVFRWVFMTLFLGLVPISIAIALYGLIAIEGLPGYLMATAGLIYFIGCFGVTACFNVPMNNALGELGAGSSALKTYWQSTYLPRWTFWNTVRTGASIMSSVVMIFALSIGPSGAI